MASKEALLNQLSLRKLKQLAKENKVLLVVEGFFGSSTATDKYEIVEILNKSRKVSKKKVEEAVFGSSKKTTSRKKASGKKVTSTKRRRILAADRSEILERQKGKCDNCGKKLNLIHKLYEIDHKKAISDGGKDTLTNFHALCLECHRKKTRKETSARAKTKRQKSVASKKPVKKKTTYNCKLSASEREWECDKKKASSSCLKRGFFDSRCDHLTVSKK